MYHNNLIRFLILVCFVHSFVWAVEGSGTHGGDNVRLLFQEARTSAAKKVSIYFPLSTSKKSEVEQWLTANQKNLVEDILKTPDYVWVDAVLAHEAMTRNERAAPIQLSLPLCRLSYNRLEDAVNLLIHESIHHLGLTDEVFVNSIVIEIDKAKREAFRFSQPAKIYICEGESGDVKHRLSLIHGLGLDTNRIVGFFETKIHETYDMHTTFNLRAIYGSDMYYFKKTTDNTTYFADVFDTYSLTVDKTVRAATDDFTDPETHERIIRNFYYTIDNNSTNRKHIKFACSRLQ